MTIFRLPIGPANADYEWKRWPRRPVRPVPGWERVPAKEMFGYVTLRRRGYTRMFGLTLCRRIRRRK
jgi:hypothetical protein